MSKAIKNQSNILKKLNIEALNPMQEEMQLAVHSTNNITLLSPTGSGKTLAFALPIINLIDPEIQSIQTLIIVPTRELAIQIEQVFKEMGTGFKVNAVYGGRAIKQDKIDLKTAPQILIGTPGRLADHFRRGHLETKYLHYLILDEFDKSLEIGFEEDMEEILELITPIKKKILTSATQGVETPEFLQLTDAIEINYLDQNENKLKIKTIYSPEKDKLDTLIKALSNLPNQAGIIFCNYKDSIQRISDHLEKHQISHACFYGGLEQQDRERALIKFRNGTHQLLLATDLAARGIDILELDFIIHYHLPLKAEEFTHRNGRTARMQNEGCAYLIQWEEEILPDYLDTYETFHLEDLASPKPSEWSTIFISGGRRDKISKGDIAGLLFKQAELKKDEVGLIELKQDCAFVAILNNRVNQALKYVNGAKLKKKKVIAKVV